MSLVTQDHHYIRDGLGKEQLFNLSIDPFEKIDLSNTYQRQEQLGRCRRLLLDFLKDNPASVEVENAYLKRYKNRLEAILDRPD